MCIRLQQSNGGVVMIVKKGNIYRDIDAKCAQEYFDKGYLSVEEKKKPEPANKK